MSNNPEIINSGAKHERDSSSLEELGDKRREKLGKQHELEKDDSSERLDDIRNEALEKAASAEVKQDKKEYKEQKEQKEHYQTRSVKSERTASYKRTMSHVQSEMNAPSRVFSKFIHNKSVEKTSETVGKTIARPNAILSGAIGGFLFTVIIYLTAKHYGYPLSGFESIAGFITGWAVGLLYDYLRLEITGRG